MRKSGTLGAVYKDCLNIKNRYGQFQFTGFARLADEPVIALAMAANHCEPTKRNSDCYIWLKRGKSVKADYFRGRLECLKDGEKVKNVMLLHFGTSRTILPLYLIESKKVIYFNRKGKCWNLFQYLWNYVAGYICGAILIVRNLRKLLNKRKRI